ncbi:MAG: hypothetical protein A3H35_07375 [Betaproteobacteria bacterium RIFCSPLOWO2_02_FULL_62_17]|nr:MAG: hypothetical protein A3H35_07375 [Betaproteobacteria bacterium RIFCSPLOWO2_02_FULL_62_17]
MSEFQLGLLGIGVTVVIAVMAFNKWQEIRYRRASELSFKSDHADLLLESDAQAANAVAQEAPAQDGPHVLDANPDADAPSLSGKAGQGARSRTDTSRLSGAIDLVALLEAPLGLSAEHLDTSGLSREIARRISFEALSEGVWVAPLENTRYQSLNVGFQLVDRQGPVSGPDLESFAAWLSAIAGRCGARAAPLDLGAAHQEARMLDKFCGDVDIQIAVHVVAGNAPFPGTRIRAIAEAAGLGMEADGKFRRRDEDGREIFSLANEGETAFQAELMRELTTASLVLEFDVARSPGGNHSFTKFRQFAEHLASGLGGRIVDDNRASLDGSGFDAIAKELAAIHQAMATRGILPGSADALRLFS